MASPWRTASAISVCRAGFLRSRLSSNSSRRSRGFTLLYGSFPLQ